ncbi:MAG TPA: hypothetical protein VFO60_09540 [Candidatus Dormibacteraeota bacterium]|nr:hypothetical protein [Candidatus Dormibacteraeota bacterium]
MRTAARMSHPLRPGARRAGVLAALLLLAAPVVAGCGSAQGEVTTFTVSSITETTSVDTTNLAGRPASPATISIVSPSPGARIPGPTMHVVIAVNGGTITSVVTKNITPTEGHVHLYVDQALIYMAYGTSQDVPVHPGTFELQAEFVAADHAPFNPRVITKEFVTVTS